MKIGIIGGNGNMGRVFLSIFKTQGIECLVSDLNTKLSNLELVSRVDVVIFSLPISSTIEIIESLSHIVTEDQMLVDITSLKSGPVSAMLKSKAEVLGLHPMFGPGLVSYHGQNVIFCPARKGQYTDRFLSLLKSAGLVLKESEPEKHDRMMAVVQGLNHINSILMAKTLSECGISLSESIEYASPVFKIRSYLLNRLMAESPALYADISLNNPNTISLVEILKKNTEEITRIINSKDKDAFEKFFTSAAGSFDDTKAVGNEKCNKLIDYVSKL